MLPAGTRLLPLSTLFATRPCPGSRGIVELRGHLAEDSRGCDVKLAKCRQPTLCYSTTQTRPGSLFCSGHFPSTFFASSARNPNIKLRLMLLERVGHTPVSGQCLVSLNEMFSGPERCDPCRRRTAAAYDRHTANGLTKVGLRVANTTLHVGGRINSMKIDGVTRERPCIPPV
jgi:hypothetical protein